MPFNFTEYHHYSIDYDSLFNEFNSLPIFKNKTLQDSYLKRWIHVLKKHDDAITQKLKTSKNIFNLKRFKTAHEPHNFQKTIHFKNNTIFIHFRISYLIKDLNKFGMQQYKQNVDLKHLTGGNQIIDWLLIEGKLDPSKLSKEPVIIVPFLRKKHDFLMIDGNHRTTYKIKNKLNDHYAIFISEESLIDNSIFSSSFDKAFYIMNNEVPRIANAVHHENANELEVIKKSFLSTGQLFF